MRSAFLDLIAEGMTAENASKRLGAGARTFYDIRRRDPDFETEYWNVRRGAIEREVDRCRENLEAATTAVEIKKWDALYKSAQWMAEKLVPQLQPVSKLDISSREQKHVIVEWRTDDSAPAIGGEAERVAIEAGDSRDAFDASDSRDAFHDNAFDASDSRDAFDDNAEAVPIPKFLPAARNVDRDREKALASGS